MTLATAGSTSLHTLPRSGVSPAVRFSSKRGFSRLSGYPAPSDNWWIHPFQKGTPVKVADTTKTSVTFDEAITSFTQKDEPDTVWAAYNDLAHFYDGIRFSWDNDTGWKMHMVVIQSRKEMTRSVKDASSGVIGLWHTTAEWVKSCGDNQSP